MAAVFSDFFQKWSDLILARDGLGASVLPVWLIPGVVFIFGSALGSFLHVCSYRLPRGQSIVVPGSHCGSCEAAIPWYDNLPLLSWLLLRGRCRRCSAAIPLSAWFFELLCALALSASWIYFVEGHAQFSKWVLWSGVFAWMMVLSLIDLEHRLLPDALTLPVLLWMILGFRPEAVTGGAELSALEHAWNFLPSLFLPYLIAATAEMVLSVTTGEKLGERLRSFFIRIKVYGNDTGDPGWVALLAGAAIYPLITGPELADPQWLDRIRAAFIAFALLWSTALVTRRITGHPEPLGWGDLKLVLCMGLLLGPLPTLYALAIATLSGALAGLWSRWRGGEAGVAFGPFLALGTLVMLGL